MSAKQIIVKDIVLHTVWLNRYAMYHQYTESIHDIYHDILGQQLNMKAMTLFW